MNISLSMRVCDRWKGEYSNIISREDVESRPCDDDRKF